MVQEQGEVETQLIALHYQLTSLTNRFLDIKVYECVYQLLMILPILGKMPSQLKLLNPLPRARSLTHSGPLYEQFGDGEGLPGRQVYQHYAY